MTTPTIPSLPLTNIVDERGQLANQWRLYFEQLTIALQLQFQPDN